MVLPWAAAKAVCNLPPTGVVQETIGMPGYARRASAQLAAMSGSESNALQRFQELNARVPAR